MAGNEQRRREAMRNLERELRKRERAEKTKPLGVVAATLAILVVIVGGIWFLTTIGGEDEQVEAESTTPVTDPADEGIEPLSMVRAEALPDTVTCDYVEDGAAAKEVAAPDGAEVPATGEVTVTLATSAGEIPMVLDRSLSPCAVHAIEHLARSGYFDDTVCHRLTTGGLNVLQCGDPTGGGTGGPGFRFADEYPVDGSEAGAGQTVVYPEGSIAMANSGPDTNGSQFFLNYADGTLPPNYSVIGRMDDAGLATVRAVGDKGVADGSGDGAPAEEVRIREATVS